MSNKDISFTGERMQQARSEAEINIGDMSEMLDISRQTYSHIEKGRISPRLELLEKFALYTHKPMSYFYETSPHDLREKQRIVNSSRHEGIVYACVQIAELFDMPDLAKQVIDTVGITVDAGRNKDAAKLRVLFKD